MSRIFYPSYDLRPLFNSAQDQGMRPTCVSFAVTACHEYFQGKLEKLSEEFLYRCCKKREGNENEGTHFSTALEVLNRNGQAIENDFPYQPHFSGAILQTSLPLSLYRKAKTNKITSWQGISSLIKTIEDTLSSGTPVISGVGIQPPFHSANKHENFIDVPALDTIKNSYHAIVITGYGSDDQGSPYFLIRNSWGEAWGDKGYGYLSYAYFQNYNIGAWLIG